MQSNGVTLDNGGETGPVVNKIKSSISNGTTAHDYDSATEDKQALSPIMKQTSLSQMETDILRLVGQFLREMGFHKTVDSLVNESGCLLEHQKASDFRTHVLSGDWDKATKSLNDLSPLLEDPLSIQTMLLLLLEEKYLEQLESGQTLKALATLRHELAPLPLNPSDKRIRVLTSYMMYPSQDDLRKAASWPGVNGGSRQILVDKLQGFLPASVMLPPQRLQTLLKQAQELQVERCSFHYLDENTGDFSLLTNHICTKCHFPCETIHTFTDHTDEVWFLKFSHDGKRLASGCKDGQIIIWNFVNTQPFQEYIFKGQSEGIAHMDWSPNDQFLLSCGRDGTPGVMVFHVETGEVKCHIQNSTEDSLTCGAWSSDGHKFYVGGSKGQFYQCSMGGSVTGTWEGVRVKALATHPTSNLVYAADTHNRIRQYNFTDKTSHTLVQESHPIMSFILSTNGKHALINVSTQSIHVWDLEDQVLLKRYQGVSQSLYTIHSSYGGNNDDFLASGSEDHSVYIWRAQRESPVTVLKGHSRTVNCVSWNPVDFEILASGSDDGTIRVWSTQERLKAQLDYEQLKEKEDEAKRNEEKVFGECGNDFGSEEGMDIQISETTSELEQTEESASSLSLSSEQLHENIVAIAVESIVQSPLSQRTESLRLRSSSQPERNPIRTNSGQWSSISEPGDSVTADLSRMRSSSHGLDSSVDPDSSVLSLDSSNGSTNQVDVSHSDFEENVPFSSSEEPRTSTNLTQETTSSSQTLSRISQDQEPTEESSLSTVV